MIYLDNSATTRVDEDVINIMNLYHSINYGNPSSLHRMGLAAEKALDTARIQLASLLGVDNKTIYFLSGGTEGNNLAISSAISKNKRLGNKLITTKIEHPSVLEVFRHFSTCGYEVCYLDVDRSGFINTNQLEEVLSEETIVVSIMKVNNEIGCIQNLKRIGEIVKKKSPQCIIHSDCVQALGKVPLKPILDGIDILTFSGHKFHGPKGSGGIYVNKELNLKTHTFGGGQERGLRSGTENVPAIVGMGMAAEIISKDFEVVTDHIKKLKSYTMELMCQQIEDIEFNSKDDDNFAPHILSVSIKDIKSEILLHLLENKDIFISSGSACSSKKKSGSHVLKSMNLSQDSIEGSLRISFSKYNNASEVEYTIMVIKEAVGSLRKYIRR
ncbi:cysteine desulfurase family protein [Alkalibaculum sporogenes]|uniref:cysteine desulfurase family protein n=1 Tax=Alkalibaculum sporogenes TaxID=2655001 RepID=UPI00128C12B7|nr:cysteine desulfurase family protein [Alkalibaculum sporogenes]